MICGRILKTLSYTNIMYFQAKSPQILQPHYYFIFWCCVISLQVLSSLQGTQASHQKVRFVEVAGYTSLSLEKVFIQSIPEEQTGHLCEFPGSQP